MLNRRVKVIDGEGEALRLLRCLANTTAEVLESMIDREETRDDRGVEYDDVRSMRMWTEDTLAYFARDFGDYVETFPAEVAHAAG